MGGKNINCRKKAKYARLIDRGPENRQHGNKPYFTGVSLPFSTGNTAATGGNKPVTLTIKLDSEEN
jgi:hypothetical protein